MVQRDRCHGSNAQNAGRGLGVGRGWRGAAFIAGGALRDPGRHILKGAEAVHLTKDEGHFREKQVGGVRVRDTLRNVTRTLMGTETGEER